MANSLEFVDNVWKDPYAGSNLPQGKRVSGLTDEALLVGVARDIFLDERGAADETVLVVPQDLVSNVQEASVDEQIVRGVPRDIVRPELLEGGVAPPPLGNDLVNNISTAITLIKSLFGLSRLLTRIVD